MKEMAHLAFDVKAVDSQDQETGAFEAVLSTSVEDRDGEIVAPGAFEPLPKSIPIFYQHDWQQKALPVGRGTPFYEDGMLKIQGWFGSDERSQSVRKAVTEGLVDSMSAGYLATEKRRVKGRPNVLKGDLFEASLTSIPVNKTALMLASKAIDDADTKAGARNSSSDSGRLQQIHDLAVENGAMCAGYKSVEPEDADTKAVEPTEPDPDLKSLDAEADTAADESTADTAPEAVSTVDESAALKALMTARENEVLLALSR